MAQTYYTLTLPIGLTFVEWANFIINDLPGLQVSIADKDTDWRDWGYDLIISNNLTALLPDTTTFPKDGDWRKWASMLNYAFG